MTILGVVRKLWWREKKVSWTLRLARFLGRSRNLAFLGVFVTLLGGLRSARRRMSHA
jgi:hypothetical protein